MFKRAVPTTSGLQTSAVLLDLGVSIGERWAELTESDWIQFASDWLRSLDDDSESEIGQSVVLMSFTASGPCQWRFIVAAVANAKTDEHLGHIAAGPFEELMSKHGDEYISRVEDRAASDPSFARMVTGAWKHLMPDHVWKRVQLIQASCPNTLP